MSICEPDYIEAFRSLGIDVIEDYGKVDGKSLNLSALVENIGRLVLENHPMFVFSINFFPYLSIVCEKLNIKYVCVSVDCPVMELFNVTIRNSCNRVFLFDHEQYLSVRDENPEGIYYLPLGAAVSRIDRTIGEYDGHADYLYDVSFVGSLYNEKDPYERIKLSEHDRGFCDALIRAQQMFTGLEMLESVVTDEIAGMIRNADARFYPSDLSVRNIDRFVAINNYFSYHLAYLDRIELLSVLADNLRDGMQLYLFTLSDTEVLNKVALTGRMAIRGGVSSLTEMPEVFRRTKINLNHTMRSIKTGLPQRIWDVMGSGGFLISNAQAEIPEYLEVGRDLETYRDMDELVDKVRYYLEHDDERERIAMRGYLTVKEKHTVLNRVVDMIRTIG